MAATQIHFAEMLNQVKQFFITHPAFVGPLSIAKHIMQQFKVDFLNAVKCFHQSFAYVNGFLSSHLPNGNLWVFENGGFQQTAA